MSVAADAGEACRQGRAGPLGRLAEDSLQGARAETHSAAVYGPGPRRFRHDHK